MTIRVPTQMTSERNFPLTKDIHPTETTNTTQEVPRPPPNVPISTLQTRNQFWKSDWDNMKSGLTTLRKALATASTTPLRVLRVSQLDAELLDNELEDMLKEQLWTAFSLFKKFNIKEKFQPELSAILQFSLYKLSICAPSNATYGCQLQNLKFRDERAHKGGLQSIAVDSPLSNYQKTMYGVLQIGGEYLWSRINRLLSSWGWSELDANNPRKIIWQSIQVIEKAFKAMSLVNYLYFMYTGKYRTLIERVLSMRLVYARREVTRNVSFEFLNRQLVWHAFTEFLMFLVPLVNLERLKNTVVKKIFGGTHEGASELPAHICAICYSNQDENGDVLSCTLNLPYETNCGHRYCYYCIQTKLMVDPSGFSCPRCGEVVTTSHRVVEKVDIQGEDEAKANDDPIEDEKS
ncbi:peroxisome assembly protein (Peroxin-2) [Basidiobolus ranarum]|uniref:RING-type E3 ubiquitin transferase (cysteine targeting) n=1 Tax=Basidiobolus ranarum TaxID=34480 RepID=A0ABR2W2X0_9FUNG